ncbi:MAG: M1 family metallopeptidase [Stenotrophomonas sp.]
MQKFTVAGACAVVSLLLSDPANAAQLRAFDILHYATTVDVDTAAGTLHGETLVRFSAVTAAARELQLDSGALTIDSVQQDGEPVPFVQRDAVLHINLLTAVRAGEVQVRYHGKPRFGLEFAPAREEVYTIFSTAQWMPSVNAPDERATLALALRLPPRLKATAVGDALPSRQLDDGRIEHRWQLRKPAPAFVYGFAAGPYVHARQGNLHYYSVDRSEAELRQLFAATGDMLGFFAERAGLAYEGDYRQALVAETIGQEMAGMAVMSEAYGKEVLDDPTQASLIAHEAAHQWWGVRVTCAGWEHFWLNEGFANFMTAAWLQQSQGEAAYQAMVQGWEKRVQELRTNGADRPLVYPQWIKPSADDRAVVYKKGAYVLHRLRQELGEEVFWRGLREYTQANDGRSVVTADFQQAMEHAAGRSLQAFFDAWVYGVDGELG